MEGAILSTQGNNSRFRTHLKNAASALCARTLPKQRRSEAAAASSRHHTYPRAAPPKRAAISCRMEPLVCLKHQVTAFELPQPEPEPVQTDMPELPSPSKPNGVVKLRGTLAREVANAWGCRVGPPDQAAPADRVQSLFNDIELYPTKSQVFEMLAWARQCARRKSFTLTFGEFCVFAAELRRCSRQARQTSNKPESPIWNAEKELRDKHSLCKHYNGSEAAPSPCEVFLGGSCNPTTWRSDIAIPMLKEMGITYFNPQVDVWSTDLMEVEHRAKAEARALLFVLDSETRAVAACVEVAHLAAAPRDLLLVLRPYTRHQAIGNETISDQEYVELSRARATLQEAVERRGLPAFSDIPAALRCARAVLRGARTHPRLSLGHTIVRLKRAYDDAAGSRTSKLPRSKAVDALKDVTRVQTEVADKCLPQTPEVDFETFCAAVAELASDSEYQGCNGEEGGGARTEGPRENGLGKPSARMKACGRKLGRLYIPKNGGNRSVDDKATGSGSGGEAVLTPGTERRLERLPAMLGAPMHDVYLGGAFPSNQPRPEDVLRDAGFSYIVPRANDYTRMFSAPARRAAPAHPESPRTDKKPRPSPAHSPIDEHVQLRDRPEFTEPTDRLSASDFYQVSEDHTPQPFKGTYDEDLLLGSRVLVFSLSADRPCFAAMVLAAHYMGLRPGATVLLVQPMTAPCSAHQYSEAAVKDYNRGRIYLTDLAKRSGVPVLDNVADAMAAARARLRL